MMKSSGQTIRVILSLSLGFGAASFILAGCQGGFKSKLYTRAEVEDYLIKVRAKNGEKTDGLTNLPVIQDTNRDPKKETTLPGSQTQNVDSSDQTKVAPTQAQSPFALAPGSGSKVMVEPAERDSLLKDNIAQMLLKNPEAVKLVHGIDLTATTVDGGGAQLNLRAIIMLGGKIHFLALEKAVVNYAKDGKVQAFENVSLRETPDGSDKISSSTQLIVSATCKDETCVELQVRMDFKIGAGIVPALFQLKLNQGKYEVADSNLKEDLKSYDAAMAELKDAVTQLQVTQTQPKATPTAQTGKGIATNGLRSEILMDGQLESSPEKGMTDKQATTESQLKKVHEGDMLTNQNVKGVGPNGLRSEVLMDGPEKVAPTADTPEKHHGRGDL